MTDSCLPGNLFLYGGASYLWAVILELAPFDPSAAQNSDLAPRFLKEFSTAQIGDDEIEWKNMYRSWCNVTLVSLGSPHLLKYAYYDVSVAEYTAIFR